VLARDDGFAPGVDRLRSAARVMRRPGEQTLRLTARQIGEQA
jgi:hypothetical protein